MFDFPEWVMEVALAIFGIGFTYWARKLQQVQKGLDATADRMAAKISGRVDHLSDELAQHARETEARLTKLETRYEDYAGIVDEVRAYLRRGADDYR